MSAFTGELSAVLGNAEYRLVLGLRGIAELQKEYGKNLEPIMSMVDQTDGTNLPDFSILFRIVELSLRRCHPNEAGDVDIVEGLITDDMSLPGRLIAAAFPSAEGGELTGEGEAGG